MRVLVTGGTGFIGAHSAIALQRAGHEICLFVRDEAKAARVAQSTGLTPRGVVVGDVTDRRAVERAVAGCDAVLHAAGAVSLDRRRATETMTVNAAGARNVLCSAVEQGIGRVVHVSSTSALTSVAGRPLGISSPITTAAGYARAKAAAEEVARALQDEGAPVHITYPSGVIGPAAGESLGETSTAVARFVAAGVMPTRQASLSLIDVRDLADLHRRLLDARDPPRRVMCAGTHLTLEQLGRELRTLTGRRFPTLPVPASVLRAAGRAADVVAAGCRMQLPMTAEAMDLVTRWPGTTDTAPTALGIEYRPIDETLEAALHTWSRDGLITRRQAGRIARTIPRA